MTASNLTSTTSLRVSPGAGESPVSRAFRLLQTVVAAGEPLGVRELSRRSGLPRSTVSRLVGILTDLGMVARTPDGSIIGGSALATLQTDGADAPLLSDQLRPLLSGLVQTFGENAAISVDDADALLYVMQVTSENAVSVPEVSGERHPFHLVAPGLVTMSSWSSDRLDVFLDGPLEEATSTSVVDPSRLRDRCAQVRADGWCWTDQELDVGVNGLAVAVSDDTGRVATVSLFGPSYRLSPQARPELAAEFLATVQNRAATLLRSPAREQ